VNFLREYFIGDYLRQNPDVLKQASIRLVYNIIIVSLFSLVIFFSIYVIKGFHYQLIKNVVIMFLFASLLFYMKYRQSTALVCHLMILISWMNNNINIYLFDEYNFFIALLTVCDIIFAFHTLGSRWGLIYSGLHFFPVFGHFLLKSHGYQLNAGPLQEMVYSEGVITLVLIFFIIIYLVYHYHKAYELAQQTLAQSVADLEKERDIAEQMTRLKTNFLSNMSHEIRTPINGILGISQVIEMETTDDAIRKYISLQQVSGRRLLNTITSILELSRLEAEQNDLSLKIVEINGLIRNEIGPLETLAKNKHLDFYFSSHPEPLFCLADENMMKQVVNNIVGNAVKYTDKGRVSIATYITDDLEQLVVEVSDTGLGISEEFLPRIFNPFEQESTGRSRTYEGTGLGLSISKKYIELLGGEIRVNSMKSVGSTFRILLPIHKQLL